MYRHSTFRSLSTNVTASIYHLMWVRRSREIVIFLKLVENIIDSNVRREGLCVSAEAIETYI